MGICRLLSLFWISISFILTWSDGITLFGSSESFYSVYTYSLSSDNSYFGLSSSNWLYFYLFFDLKNGEFLTTASPLGNSGGVNTDIFYLSNKTGGEFKGDAKLSNPLTSKYLSSAPYFYSSSIPIF